MLSKRKTSALYTLIILIALSLCLAIPSVQAQSESGVLVLTLDGPLTPAMTEYISRGIEIAEREGVQLVVIQLDTPGGSISIMQEIVSAIRNSNLPILIYVSPQGAIAGSAGTVITLAGHRAAMAPETAIGAASPVGSGGEDLGETIKQKSEEIIKAQIRSLAKDRGEQAVLFAEETVESAKAATAHEALEVGLIDYIAEDLSDLLLQVDGSLWTIKGETIQLSTKNVEPQYLNLSLIEELLQMLTNPNIVFLLIAVGVQAILIELSSPGGWVPGFIGVICLALATYGLGILPVNWFGIVFLITAFVLFTLDIKAPTHGALTAAGVASLIVSALVLFNSPGTPQFQRVSIWLVVTVSSLTGGLFAAIMAFAVQTRKTPIKAGPESLRGQIGFARTEISTHKPGQVQVGGEQWSAKLAPDTDPISPGQRIEVVDIEGIHLLVQTKG
jgi:membrane-bound serine protease (ClpP class)